MKLFIYDENGQGMLEYVLIIAIVALIAVAIIVVVKTRLNQTKEPIESLMDEI